MLTLKKIKVIYCYLVCLAMVICIGFTATSLAYDLLRIFFFDNQYHYSTSLDKTAFYNQEKYKGMNFKQIEGIRQNLIEEEKNRDKKYLKRQLLRDIPSLTYLLIILLVHAIIIRRTKE